SGGRAVSRIDNEGFVNARGFCEIDYNPRAARHDQAKTKGLDQAATRFARLRRQSKADLRDIDDDAAGIGKCKNVQIDLPLKISHEPRLRLATSDSDLGSQRK